MTNYEVFVEIGERGQAVAHVLAVPGCFAVGDTVEAATTAVSDILQARFSKETRFPEETITLSVAECLAGPRVIFTPERQPITRDEVERYLAQAADNRAELQRLVRPLTVAMRRWKPYADHMSIHDILRHVGGAEWWFITRLWGELPKPQVAPPMTFLSQTRDTAVTHIRQLSDEQLATVITPTFGTRYPQEAWSARKLLRRLLEHEQEHISHIHQVLAAWRAHYLARLRAERAGVLWQLRSLSEETLTASDVIPGWSARNLLIHIAHYDAVHTEKMQKAMDGRVADIQPLGDETGLVNYNAALLAQIKEIPLEQALALFLKERSGFQAAFQRASDTDLHRSLPMPWGQHTSMRVWANWRYRHDKEHAQHLAAWRATLPVTQRRQGGPKYILRALLHATRQEFTSLLGLLPQAEWLTRPVCGVWTIKDLVGHLADWEKVALDGMRQLAAGQTPAFHYELPDFDQFNNTNAAHRQGQPWDEVWADFESTRGTLLTLLDVMPEEALQCVFKPPWGGTLPGYVWMLIWPAHEREHAVDVRAALKLLNWPKALRRHP